MVSSLPFSCLCVPHVLCVSPMSRNLAPKELKSLMGLLSDESRSMDQVATAFQRQFLKPEQFKAASAIVLMLQGRLLTQTQWLFGLHLLFDIYKSEAPGTNPFLPVLVAEAKREDLSNTQRNFVLHLLNHPPKDVRSSTTS